MQRRKDLHTASVKHLRKDPHLGAFIKDFGPIVFRRKHSRNTFRALAESIMYQQVSGKAADSILKRFVALFPNVSFPTPKHILKTPETTLRSAGLSGQKARYIRDLAGKYADGTIEPKKFGRMSDEEIIAHVTRVKGIGEWTAHMFLMFTLERPDILPTGDLAIQKGFQKVFKLKERPSPEKMKKLAKNWAGHRSVASFYLWRMLDDK